MDRKFRRRLAIGGAVLVALGAAGGAYAVTSSNNNQHDAYLNDLAGRLHVSRAQLDSALKGAFQDRLDAAVKAGTLSQADADAIKKKIEQGGGAPPPFGGPGPFLGKGPGGTHDFGFGFGKFAPAADQVAHYLGLTPTQLKDQLGSGKSLADVAKAQNKPLDGLKNEIKAAAKKQLDSLVASKKISQSDADNALSELTSHIDDLVNVKPPDVKSSRNGKIHPHFNKRFERPGAAAPAGPDGFFF